MTRDRLLAIAAAFLAMLVLIVVGLAVEPRHDSLADLKTAQEEAGFVFLGSFGNDWPARVVDEVTARDAIEFQRADGSRHSYEGFPGYELKLLRLKGRHGEEIVVVLRSREPS